MWSLWFWFFSPFLLCFLFLFSLKNTTSFPLTYDMTPKTSPWLEWTQSDAPARSDTPTSQAGFLANATGIRSAFLQPALRKPQRSHPPATHQRTEVEADLPGFGHRSTVGQRVPMPAGLPPPPPLLSPLGSPAGTCIVLGGVGAGSIQLPAAAGSAPPSSAGSYHSCSPAFSLTEDCEWVSRSIHFLYSLCSVYLFLFFAGCWITNLFFNR